MSNPRFPATRFRRSSIIGAFDDGFGSRRPRSSIGSRQQHDPGDKESAAGDDADEELREVVEPDEPWVERGEVQARRSRPNE
jgi:hypothetical protein